MEGLMRKLVLLLLLCVMAHGATPLTGKWSGSFDITNADGENKPDSAYMDLNEHDGKVAEYSEPQR